MTDRTLDQQCTVTRPGIAAIASALVVEILVSLLQHPLGALAPAPAHPIDDRDDNPLGIVPHQIRGFLSTFDNKVIRGKSYDCCSACSDKIIDTYKADGWAFVQRAMNERCYVEELSGLAEVSSCRFWNPFTLLTRYRSNGKQRKRWPTSNGAMTATKPMKVVEN